MADQRPAQRPSAVVRLALRCYPAWWRAYYGVDAASTAVDAESRDGASVVGASALFLNALGAHLRGPGAFASPAVEAAAVALDRPSARWRVLSSLMLLALVALLAIAVGLIVFGVMNIAAHGPTYLRGQAGFPIDTSFDAPRALGFFVPLLLIAAATATETVVLVRGGRTVGRWSRFAGATSLSVVAIGGGVGATLIVAYWQGPHRSGPPTLADQDVPVGVLVLAALGAGWLLIRWHRLSLRRAVAGLAVAIAALVLPVLSSGAAIAWNSSSAFVGGSFAPDMLAGFWSVSLARSPLSFDTVSSCPSSSVCFTAGAISFNESDNLDGGGVEAAAISVVDAAGVTRRVATMPNESIGALGCWSDSGCIAEASVDAVGAQPSFLDTTDGWRSWRSVPAPSSGPLACSPQGTCYVIETTSTSGHRRQLEVLATSDAGLRWERRVSTVPLGDDVSTLSSFGLEGEDAPLQCPTTLDCWLYDSANNGGPGPRSGRSWVARTLDGGRRWERVLLPRPDPVVFGLSCPSALRCVAIVGPRERSRNQKDQPDVLVSTDNGGGSWKVASVAAEGLLWSLIDCPTPSRCAVWGRGGQRDGPLPVEIRSTANVGHTWSTAYWAGPFSIGLFDCSTSSRCVAVATFERNANNDPFTSAVFITENGGRAWRKVP